MTTQKENFTEKDESRKIELHYIEKESELPNWITMSQLIDLFHSKMQPYHDKKEDVQKALNYAFAKDKGQGGFLVIASTNKDIMGATLILKTGMGGYVPENLLLFVVVNPEMRGQGIGKKIINYAISKCKGDIKLHVEHDNPARRLYERIGFENKYVEMRYSNS